MQNQNTHKKKFTKYRERYEIVCLSVWWRTIYHLQNVQHKWYSEWEKNRLTSTKKIWKLNQLALYTCLSFVSLVYLCTTLNRRSGEMSSVCSQFVLLFSVPGCYWQIQHTYISNVKIVTHCFIFLLRNSWIKKNYEDYLLNWSSLMLVIKFGAMFFFGWENFAQKII